MDIAGRALGPLIGSLLATAFGIKKAMAWVIFFWIVNVFFWLPVLRHLKKDLANLRTLLNDRAAAMVNPKIKPAPLKNRSQ